MWDAYTGGLRVCAAMHCMCAYVSLQEQMREALCAVKEVIDGSCLDQLQIWTILVKVWCVVLCCAVVWCAVVCCVV